MSIAYSTALKTTRMNAVLAAIDAGSGAGRMEIGTSAMGTVLATITLADPCATVTNGVLTFAGFPRSDTAADATGTAAAAVIKDSDGNVIISGLTVGLSASDIVLDGLAVAAGQVVTISSAVITHG